MGVYGLIFKGKGESVMPEIFVTEEDIRQASTTAVGSKFFAERANIGGAPTLVLNTALRMRADEFRQDYDGTRGYYALEALYQAFGTQVRNYFFNFDRAYSVEDYGVFSFHATEEWQSLRQSKLPLSAEMALDIFRQLVKLLRDYSRCSLNRDGYRPLLFICRDSVYVSFDGDGALQVCLLPMPYDAYTQYAGMPREVFTQQGDVSADLYMAAYLYLQLKYPNGEPFAEDAFAQYDLLAERCLSPFKQRRPSLQELLAQLEEPSDCASATGEKEEEDTELGGIDYHIHVEPEQEEERPSALRPRPAFFEGLRRKKEAGTKKIKRVTGKLSGAQDIFDDILSTEQGDSEEDDT